MEDVALKTLDEAMREFNGDPRRVTLTGVSMGGSGVWDLASRFPGRFAAIAPVCGEIGPPGVPASAHDASRSAQASSVYAQVARKSPGHPSGSFMERMTLSSRRPHPAGWKLP